MHTREAAPDPSRDGDRVEEAKALGAVAWRVVGASMVARRSDERKRSGRSRSSWHMLLQNAGRCKHHRASSYSTGEARVLAVIDSASTVGLAKRTIVRSLARQPTQLRHLLDVCL